MELVYLWVEEYKNIKNQGFNFSPRFECEYKDGNLTICDKKKKECKDNEYLENFFGENINVTAIVGENGTGKSNVFEIIITLLTAINKSVNSESKVYMIFFKNDMYYYKTINMKKPNNEFEELSNENLDTFTMNFNYSLDYPKNNQVNFNDLYHKVDSYNTPIHLIPDKKFGQIDISNLNYLQNRTILKFTIQNNQTIQNIESFFIPIEFSLFINTDKIYEGLPNYNENDVQVESIRKENYTYLFKKDKQLIDKSQSKYTKYDLILLNNLYLIKKIYNILEIKGDILNDEELKKYILNYDWENNYQEIIKILDVNTYTSLFRNISNEKIEDSFKFRDFIFKKDDSYIFEFSQGNNYNIQKYKEILEYLPAWIDIKFYDEKKIDLDFLSYGQKILIRFIYTILYQLLKIKKTNKYSSINLFLDEIEIGLHPKWQKDYISLLLKVLTDYFKDEFKIFNIVCATHSPFILSDIPKENVIFLDKFDKKETKIKYPKLDIKGLENGNCINVSKHIELKTFGANIHTLLADGFFMTDGLMGEFAKSKINEIKDFYDTNKNLKKEDSNFESKKDEFKKNKKYFENIQKIIGEPFLKTVIKNYLDELEILFYGKKEFLNNEIKRLQDLQKSLND
ncbi:AAA family ATPase [Arcobacter caeni]|uniref:ATPase AAA-type core domain-containing protein n=1 Tax=Arcobacter caeni TaxID=1912877 RepID=A0A363CXE8_9BACT|nr:AAA family ATPase [Arcobacter caeni]PUE63693.1 hypothetical protein B0174_09735 [Arcobacter caeni]